MHHVVEFQSSKKSVPLCSKCDSSVPFGYDYLCKKGPLSIVDGKPITNCKVSRAFNMPCGPEGKMFSHRRKWYNILLGVGRCKNAQV